MLWNLLFALCLSGALKYGNYITNICPQGGYACPTICEVDHKHFPRSECEEGKSKKVKGDIMPSPKKCAEKFKKGSAEYKRCVEYAGNKKAKTDKVPTKGY